MVEQVKKELSDTFEILVNEKTYVSKKVNPIRRALIMRNLMKNSLGMSDDAEKMAESLETMTMIIEKYLPETMWAFIKDEDKQAIGDMTKFVEDLDDNNTLQFMQWAVAKVNEVKSFLVAGQ